MTDPSGRRQVPFHIDLGQQKTRAKELLRDLRAGEPAALRRLQAQRPEVSAPQLADAQFVIAREVGLPSWPRLKAHATALERERAAIRAAMDGKALPPDAGCRTAHVRCGSDIQGTLAAAGFVGDFLEHSDPYPQGPVTHGPDWLAVRARFIAEAYGGHGYSHELSERAAAEKLEGEERALSRAATTYDRVVLWCEHDSYDQLNLARCLAQFAETGRPRVLELISIDRFPGSMRFIGLGQLPPEALRMLWPTRRPVTEAALEAGCRTWDALRSDDPRDLAAISRSRIEGLPDLPGALRRHLHELPWTGDGLSLTERMILQIIGDDSLTVGRVFARLMMEREPRPWMTDIMFLATIVAMARAREPAFTLPNRGADVPWPQWRMEITAAGLAILGGAQDWLALGPPDRWVGGVLIRPGAKVWRWDEAEEQPMLR
ncbi:MAG TPA: DUF1835 domain-containing protein [Azospirillum sp.]|nr:DUF1835 domain-containing protein [Azospirillum sp.]